ncbi:CpaF family protein [Candidatus Micrarchaeota archaeon]|nr:CpaF family protein [Candidatus Micrarchaeota archaeon]
MVEKKGQNEKKSEEKKENVMLGKGGATRKLDSYSFVNEDITVNVQIIAKDDYVPYYEVYIPGIAGGTKLMLETKLRGELISKVRLDITEILDPKKFEEVKIKFLESASQVLDRNFPTLTEEGKRVLSAYLVQSTLGLGELENLLADEKLEEVVINNSREPVWVYHKKYGWCKTNMKIKDEELIYDYSSMIGRKIGRQINVLNPMLDAHLPSGDRVNATLFPISNFGNTMTIRKFSRNPWTMVSLIKNKTLSPEVAGLIWLCVQNELSLLVSGGTGSGKTSFLNAVASLIPASQRVISIEDTRELTLPKFMHWVPMVTREPNPEGKGEVSMLDLMINALRQRPDRILVGEVRRQKEAEILFEAMHTGHSVYSTLHADNAEQTISRLTTPPINLPAEILDALTGIVVTFRHRRFGMRRVLEFTEVMKDGKINPVYKWNVKSDKIKAQNKISRLAEILNLYAGMTEKEIQSDVEEKSTIFNWMVNKDYSTVNQVGEITSHYNLNPDEILSHAEKGKSWSFGRF